MATSQTTLDETMVETLAGFLRDYYEDDIATAHQRGDEWLQIRWRDVFQFDSDLAEDLLDAPEWFNNHITAALERVDLPIPSTPNLEIHIVGLPEHATYSPSGVPKLEEPGYIAVRGQLTKVTTPATQVDTAVFTCQRCGADTKVPQVDDELQEPHECGQCGRQGPFSLDWQASELTHYARCRLESPPDESGKLQNDSVDGEVEGELCWIGHDDYGLVARSGERATIYGEIDYEPLSKNSTLFKNIIDVDTIEFQSDKKTVNIREHRETFEEIADRDDAIKSFKESIVPQLHATPEWEHALELLVAYLFGSPRVDVQGGPTYRGDIHALIVSDYGMGKSMVNEAIAEFSPDCIKESVTGLSSDVGLLAAAVKDDFGEGESWTLEPGILVRGNGGHVILDEIDKTDASLERMNDALEGEQMVDINKAGQSATFKSRVGLLATGNPSGSRFDVHAPVAEQLDIDESLLSRFDGIVTMRDTADEDTDAAVASTLGHSYVEAHDYQYGEREELDQLEREVPPEVGRAWVAYARKHVHPRMPPEYIKRIEEWYATEIRQLNHQHGTDADGEVDMPVPATTRVVAATIRFAGAFARAHLRDVVSEEDIERAMELQRALIGQTFDGDSGTFSTHTIQAGDQQSRVETVKKTIRAKCEDSEDGAVPTTDVVKTLGESYDTSRVEKDIDNLLRKGEIMEPVTGKIRPT